MAIFDFFNKKNETAKKSETIVRKKPEPAASVISESGLNQVKNMTEEIRSHSRNDFGPESDKKDDIHTFCLALERSARKHVEKQQARAQKDGQASETLPVDALSLFHVSADHMTAYACVLPPLNGGKEINTEQFMEDMRYEGISAGIDMEAVQALGEERKYLRILQIAQGTQPQDGRDGELEEMYSRGLEQTLELDENQALSGLDFRKQHAIETIRKGDIICRIKPPVEAQDGFDVSGRALYAKRGQPAYVPQGENTSLSEDGSILCSDSNGILMMDGDDFSVRSHHVLEKDSGVDMNDQNYEGSLLIYGDLEDGESVAATGDIIINGDVRGGKILAGGTIRVNGDIKGAPGTQVEARRQIQCVIMENCLAVAGEDIYAEVITNSTAISEEGSVYALMGRGLLFGGDVTAGRSIYAKKIGNISGCINCVTLGFGVRLDKQRASLTRELDTIRENREQARKSISYMKAAGVSNQRGDQWEEYQKLIEKRKMYDRTLKNKMQELEDLEKRIHVNRPESICCDEMFPGTHINIDGCELEVVEKEADCRVHAESKKIIMR
ncbi:DUF342 domain-containing protein [Clostridiaceae bacterium]|nr:DUF342 domain-containing protein [Clostridiaceae bacterium]